MISTWFYQTISIAVISILFTAITYVIVGPPDRTFKCVQSEMKDNHVCLDLVLNDWKNDVLWVDARSQAEFNKKHLPGAILIPEKDIENKIALPQNMQKIGMAGVNGQKVVVYCATDACGSSALVANKILATGFHTEVYVLHGGWKAVSANVELLEKLTQNTR